MKKINFNADWTVTSGTSSNFAEKRKITLPYDAMIHNRRTPDAVGQYSSGFFPSGKYVFEKRFHVPSEYRGKRIEFLFEGIYMNAIVSINGAYVDNHPYGYSPFVLDATAFLRFGEDNTIAISCVTSRDCRWYSGCGIYRDVCMLIGESVHIVPNGVHISTPDVEQACASVQTDISIRNISMETRSLSLRLRILDNQGAPVAENNAAFTAFANRTITTRRRIFIQNPHLWNADAPVLYALEVCLMDGDVCLEKCTEKFGIRKLQLDPFNGLRVNGVPTKLRGVCFHHDNGILGAANFKDYEYRRVALAKRYGANAIRSVHNPASPYLLEACDELGMYVMEEAFDMWNLPRFDYDYSRHFSKWWEKDVEAMVDRDYNHPSVIMYSIGNELPETGNPSGADQNRKIAAKLHELDHHRYVINCVNGMLSIGDRLDEVLADLPEKDGSISKPKTCEINTLMSELFDKMPTISKHHIVSKMTEETFADLDIAGYNYMSGRYIMDRALYPNRMICGTESGIPTMGELWEAIKNNANIIGDFTWSGAEYLGEAGICKYDYEMKSTEGIFGDYPWYIANSGMFDLIGIPRDGAYFMQIAWQLTDKPHITVQRPQRYGQPYASSFWALSDAISSWTYPGFEGKPVIIEVFSSAEEVELRLNGQPIGRKSAGLGNRITAAFETVYAPGTLEAIAYTGGTEVGRDILETAGEAVKIVADANAASMLADPAGLVFVTMYLADRNGNVNRFARAAITAEVEGPAVIQGFGSGDPTTEEIFDDLTRTTFDGYAMLALRPTGKPGTVNLTLKSDGYVPASVSIRME